MILNMSLTHSAGQASEEGEVHLPGQEWAGDHAAGFPEMQTPQLLQPLLTQLPPSSGANPVSSGTDNLVSCLTRQHAAFVVGLQLLKWVLVSGQNTANGQHHPPIRLSAQQPEPWTARPSAVIVPRAAIFYCATFGRRAGLPRKRAPTLLMNQTRHQELKQHGCRLDACVHWEQPAQGSIDQPAASWVALPGS